MARYLLVLSTLVSIGLFMSSSSAATTAAAPATRPVDDVPVLVELYTSEGCSSCPPADALLERLAHDQHIAGARIVPIAYHVDYWNRLGWADRFSDPAYSDRQQAYARALGDAGPYTPQMIVDGADGFVGSDEARATASIAAAAREAKHPVSLTVTPDRSDAATVHVSVRVPVYPTARATPVEVFLVVTEDDLSTEVRRGENAGRHLHHTSVARHVERLAAADLTRAPVSRDVDVRLDPTWRRSNVHVVVYVQVAGPGAVLGLASRPAGG